MKINGILLLIIGIGAILLGEYGAGIFCFLFGVPAILYKEKKGK